jgi:uncharacterized protein
MTLLWLYAIPAAILIGVSKTGLPGVSILAIVLMTEAYPGNAWSSAGAILPVLLAGDVFAVAWYRRHADWGRLASLLPYVAAGMAPGAWFLYTYRSDTIFRPFVGWIVLGMLAVEVGRRRFHWEKLPHRWWFTAVMGVAAGFTTLVANAAMPIMSIYLVSQKFDKHRFVGTVAWFFLILNAIKVPICLAIGNFPLNALPETSLLMPVTIAGALLGLYVFAKISQRYFDALALILAAVAAVKLLVT